MHKIMDKMDAILSPVADKLANNRVMKSIANGMMVMMPLTMVAALFSMVEAILGIIIDLPAAVSAAILLPYNTIFGALALIVSITVAYKYAESYELNPINHALISVLTFLIVVGGFSSGFLGYAGIFTAVIVAILTVEISRFCLTHKIRIAMPDSVPPLVASSFENLLPMLAAVGLFYGLSLIAQAVSGGMLLPELVNKVVTPAISGADTAGYQFVYKFFMQLFFWFGLHGWAILAGISMPISNMMIAANIEAHAAGQALPYATAGGVLGGPFNFIVPLLLLTACKAKRNNALGKLSIVPGMFGISEPFLFGTPVMMNPILAIPFILCEPTFCALHTILIKAGLQNYVYMQPANIPGMVLPISTFIATDYDWRVFLWWAVFVVLTILVWIPFIKIWDKRCLREEAEQEAALAAEAAQSENG